MEFLLQLHVPYTTFTPTKTPNIFRDIFACKNTAINVALIVCKATDIDRESYSYTTTHKDRDGRAQYSAQETLQSLHTSHKEGVLYEY